MRRLLEILAALFLALGNVLLVLMIMQLACPKPPGHPLPADEATPGGEVAAQ